MTARIVMADQAGARFYALEAGGALRCVGEITDAKARLHDRDFKSDRPGRVFDHAAGAGQRRGAVGHHATGGEETPRNHEATAFARRIVQTLEAARNANEFDQLVVIAGPRFMGRLRDEMPKSLAEMVVLEIGKDLMHEPEESIRAHLPPEVLRAAEHRSG